MTDNFNRNIDVHKDLIQLFPFFKSIEIFRSIVGYSVSCQALKILQNYDVFNPQKITLNIQIKEAKSLLITPKLLRKTEESPSNLVQLKLELSEVFEPKLFEHFTSVEECSSIHCYLSCFCFQIMKSWKNLSSLTFIYGKYNWRYASNQLDNLEVLGLKNCFPLEILSHFQKLEYLSLSLNVPSEMEQVFMNINSDSFKQFEAIFLSPQSIESYNKVKYIGKVDITIISPMIFIIENCASINNLSETLEYINQEIDKLQGEGEVQINQDSQNDQQPYFKDLIILSKLAYDFKEQIFLDDQIVKVKIKIEDYFEVKKLIKISM